MRRLITILTAMLVVGAMALPAYAPNEKYQFSDVTFSDGQTGEIEATVKTQKNKDDSVYCGYFTDDYQESLGYYFERVDTAPTTSDAVLDFCLEWFEERNT